MDFSKLTEYLNSLEKDFSVPGCDCAVMYKHAPVYRHNVGYADVQRTKGVSAKDLYFMFSATKIITCTAALQLIEQGKLSLDDAVDKYLPEFSQMQVLSEMPPMPMFSLPENAATRLAERKIRIIDLFTMTSGLSYDIQTTPIRNMQKATGGKASTREMIRAIAQSPLICEPGQHWIYSLSHDVLAAVVEEISEKTFGEYLKQYIFAPLEMEDAYFSLSPKNSNRLAALYMHGLETPEVTPIKSENRFCLSEAYESGGAGLICSTDTYIKFVDAMCNGGVSQRGERILKQDTINLMRRNHLNPVELEDFKKSGKVGYGYGLGVRTLIDKAASCGPVGEFGWDGAAGAYVLIDTENNIGIFYVEHIFRHFDSYKYIHPTIRDMVYRAILE